MLEAGPELGRILLLFAFAGAILRRRWEYQKRFAHVGRE